MPSHKVIDIVNSGSCQKSQFTMVEVADDHETI